MSQSESEVCEWFGQEMQEEGEVVMSKGSAGVWAGRVIAMCLVAAVISVPTMASANELSLKVGFQSQATRQPGYDAFGSENALFSSNIEVGYANPSLLPNVEGILVLQGYENSAYGDSTFADSLELTLGGQRVMVGADMGVMVGRYFRPSVRLGVGYSHMRLSMRPLSGTQYVDHAHDVVGFGSLGGALVIPLSIGRADLTGRTRWKLGVQSHLGYMAQTRADFSEMEAVGQPEEDPWRRSAIDAGSLPNAGMLFDLSVFIGYRF